MANEMQKSSRRGNIEKYAPSIGAEVMNRITLIAKLFRDFRVVNLNFTFYGDGVTEKLLLSA